MNTPKRLIIGIIACAAIFVLLGSVTGNFTSLAFNDKNAKKSKIESPADSKEIAEPNAGETGVISASDLGHYNLKNLQSLPAVTGVPAGTDLGDESEPNDAPATADVLTGTDVKIRGNIFPNGDIDYFSFNANAGDRVFTAVMGAFSASGSNDSVLTLYNTDGTTVIETDDNDGSFGASSSTIAGATIPATGTYFLRVNHVSATNQLRPYELYLRVQSGAPVAEVEPNDTPATANVLPSGRFVSGARNPAAATEQDWYSLTLNAGDTVYLGLDLDPERDNVQWDGRLGFALFGDTNNQILVVNDASVGSAANPLSEAMFFTVKNAGTYYAFVDSANAAVGGPTATYNLSVSVFPRTPVGVNCTTYTSTNVPQTIGPGAGLVSSTLTVPGSPRIASMRVLLDLNHALMQDIDVHLRSPAGNDNGLFTDIGAAAVGGQTLMDLIIDDYAAVPPTFTVLRPYITKPELNYRLDWFNGENAGGTWTLDIRDDSTNTSGGTLNNWGLEICEQPAPVGTLIYNENFEPALPPLVTGNNTAPLANNGGYTSSGTANEWEYGVPTAAPIIGCNEGSTGCWKTDLDNTYNASSNQDLVSPQLSLVPYLGTVNLSWAMKYQMESASFDNAFVEVQDIANPANNRVVWRWNGATMQNTVGSPAVTINESAGWGIYNANISDFAGKLIRLRFHVDTDTTVQLGGLAIDDVQLRYIGPVAANAGISGRVTDQKGNGISRARVTITGTNGEPSSVLTNSFGYYRFESLAVGQTYVIETNRKGYAFSPRVVTLQEEVTDADIIAIE